MSNNIKVRPSSDLAGYHYETNVGRHAAFFWQASSGSLYGSTFLQMGPTWASIRDPVLVATDARDDTPIAAVNWSNGVKAAVYYLDGNNVIHERVSSDSGQTWVDGALTAFSVPTRSSSDLGAIIQSQKFNADEISVYFQDEMNQIRELRYAVQDSHWREEEVNGYRDLQGLAGTSIACVGSKGYVGFIVLSKVKVVHHFGQYRPNGHYWTAGIGDSLKDVLKKSFPRKARLGYTYANIGNDGFGRYYTYDSGEVMETMTQPERKTTTLPTDGGKSKICRNFIALSWGDMDRTSPEYHLFSLDENGLLWDYLVGGSSSSSASVL